MGIMGTFEGYSTSPLYLFNNGVWSNLKVSGATIITSNLGNYIITLNPPDQYKKYLRMNHTNNSSHLSVARLNSTVNLSSYTYLNLQFQGTWSKNPYPETGGIGISQSSNATSFSAFIEGTDISNDNQSTTIILNISNVTGEWFIYFTGRTGNAVASTIAYEQIYLT